MHALSISLYLSIFIYISDLFFNLVAVTVYLPLSIYLKTHLYIYLTAFFFFYLVGCTVSTFIYLLISLYLSDNLSCPRFTRFYLSFSPPVRHLATSLHPAPLTTYASICYLVFHLYSKHFHLPSLTHSRTHYQSVYLYLSITVYPAVYLARTHAVTHSSLAQRASRQRASTQLCPPYTHALTHTLPCACVCIPVALCSCPSLA